MQTAGKQSLYVHVPFCRRRCHYCHFYVVRNSASQQELYWQALQREWALRGSQLSDLVSCYLGGGTPSLLAPERIGQLIAQLPNSPEEITLEANPEECVPELLTQWRAAGVNRLSIGIQVLDDPLLVKLNRIHSAAQAEKAVWAAAAAGFENITIDLMYDLPDQSLASWEETLQRAMQLPITHLSLYNLVIEPGSLYARRQTQITARMPDEPLSCAMWEVAHQTLETAGFTNYALSAFERGGHPSIHNLGYWTGRPFLGLGPSAWSYWNGCRIQNLPDLHNYADHLASSREPVATRESLPPDEARREQLVLALRLQEGVIRSQFEARWGPLELTTLQSLTHLQEEGLLASPQPNRWQPTRRGFQLFDSIAAALV
jgi:oxygen-independent coproporphyrinogen III oxidase